MFIGINLIEKHHTDIGRWDIPNLECMIVYICILLICLNT